MKYCYECGNKMVDEDLFCMACGARQEVPKPEVTPSPAIPPKPQSIPQTQPQAQQPVQYQQPIQPNPQTQTAKKKSGVMTAILIILFVLIIAIIGALIFLIMNRDKDSGAGNNRKNDEKIMEDGEEETSEDIDGESLPRETGEGGTVKQDPQDENNGTEAVSGPTYQEIVRNYYDAANMDHADFVALYGAGDEYLNVAALDGIILSGGELVYTMCDSNNDGKEELLIAQRYEDGGVKQVAVYIMEEDKVVRADKEADSVNFADVKWTRLVKIKTDAGTAESESIADIPSAEPDYILPESSTRLLTFADLEGLDAEQCRIARNEIYARHGRKFKDEALQAYFNSKSWYNGYIEPADFTDTMLSDIENKNKDLIVKYEEAQGFR